MWLLVRVWWLLALCAPALFLTTNIPIVSVGVWIAIAVAWHVNRDAVRVAATTESTPLSPAVLFPAIVAVQCLLDHHYPIGSVFLLQWNLEAIAKVRHRNVIPNARARFSRSSGVS